MKKLGLYLVGAILTLITSILAAHVATVVYVRVYAFRLGVPLHTLSDDYGMGFEFILVALITFVFVLISGLWLTYLFISSNKR